MPYKLYKKIAYILAESNDKTGTIREHLEAKLANSINAYQDTIDGIVYMRTKLKNEICLLWHQHNTTLQDYTIISHLTL